MVRHLFAFLIVCVFCASVAAAQGTGSDDKALAVIARAVGTLGGERYLHVTTQVGRGSFSQIRKEGVASYQSFTDAIAFPDKERTDFKGSSRSVQVNTGDTGWIYDGDQEILKLQTPVQIETFKRSNRTSLDTLLRGYWKGQAILSYVGRRQGGVGRRNDVIRLTYNDGFTVEFEFADDGTPVKALYKHKDLADDEVKDEDRYAQFVDIDGIKTPFIIDHYLDGAPASRVNYDSVEFNKPVAASVFIKPLNSKDARKEIRY